MHPILFRLPLPGWNLPWLGKLASLPIYSYGVMLGLSLVVGWYLTLRLADRDGLPPDEMANCYVVTAIAALIGARLLYVVTNLDEFHSLGDWFAFRRGGLVAYGGFLGGFLGSWAYLRRHQLALLPWADVAVPSLASGLFLTRIGCYLFGCDFGKRLPDGAPALLKRLGTFPQWPPGTLDSGTGSPAWYQQVERHLIGPGDVVSLPVHPTQLYESMLGLLLLGMVLWQRKHRRFPGQVFLTFTFAYGAARYVLEIWRDDVERGEFGPLVAEHWMIPIGLGLLGLGYIAGIAPAIRSAMVRRVSQGVALVPALVVYVVLRPASFTDQALVKLSTSQWVALLTGGAAALAYGALDRAETERRRQAATPKRKKKRRVSTATGASEGASGVASVPSVAAVEPAAESAEHGETTPADGEALPS